MSKKLLLTLLLLPGLLLTAAAQGKLNVSVKGGLLFGAIDVESRYLGVQDLDSERSSGNTLFSVSASLPVKPKFRLGGEVGLISFRHSFDKQITDQSNSVSRYLGVYEIQQFFIAVVPEYRPFEWIFLNGGAGLFLDTDSKFGSGAKILTGPQTEDLSNRSFKRSNPFGIFVGAGICKNIAQKLAVLAEVRLMASPSSISDENTLGISYNAINFNIGLMYKLR